MGFPAFLAKALISIAISMAISYVGRPSGKDRRTKGFGFEFRENPADPNDPLPIVYGAPVWLPPVLTRWVEPEGLNSLAAVATARFRMLVSLGAGPIDSRDLTLWMNDQKILETVSQESESGAQTLDAADSERKTFYFPKSNVMESSVVLYLDGVAYARFDNGGILTDDSLFTKTSSQRVNSVVIAGDSGSGVDYVDSSIRGSERRIGCILPAAAPASHALQVKTKQSLLGTATRDLSRSEKGFGTTDGKTRGWFGGTRSRRYLYVNDKDAYRHWVLDRAFGKSDPRYGFFLLTYFAGERRPVEFGTTANGRNYVVFPHAITGGVDVTATYKTSKVEDGITYQIRKGEQAQDPLPLDDVRLTVPIEAELTKGTPREYEGAREVDDLVINLTAPDGFVDVAVHGADAGDTRDAFRHVEIYLKTSAAADQAGGLDVTAGWVQLKDPTSNNTTFRLQGQVNGPAQWYFSAADLLAYTLNGNAAKVTANALPRSAYDVKVVATDEEGIRLENPPVSTESVTNDLYFGNVAEVQRTQLTLPGHATLTVEVEDMRNLPAEPVFAVRLAGRQVWVPESTATLNTDTGLPEPGAWKWTRNPVWCAIDLITDAEVGAGDFFGWSNISLAEAIAAAAFCDETVDGETRAELDYVVSDRSALLDHVARMLAGAQVIPVLTGGTWKFLKDVDGDTVMDIVAESDVQNGEITAKHLSIEEIPNRVEFAYTDEDVDGELVTDYITLPDAEPSQIVQRRIDLRGVRRRTEARRIATLLAYQWANNRIAVDIAGASYRLLALEAGDLVTLTSQTLGYTSKKFRVTSVGWGSNLQVALRLVEHSREAYIGRRARKTPIFFGIPAHNAAAPSAPLVVPQLTAERIT